MARKSKTPNLDKLKEIAKLKRMKALRERQFYLLRSVLGNDWALFFFLLGGRCA